MPAPPALPATRSANAAASGLMRCLVGEAFRRSGQGKLRGAYTPSLHGACRLQSDPPAKAVGGVAMSILGKWRVVETADHDRATEGSYILSTIENGEFAPDWLIGDRYMPVRRGRRRVHMDCSDEMEPARDGGWAEELAYGLLVAKNIASKRATCLLSRSIGYLFHSVIARFVRCVLIGLPMR